MRFLSKPYCTDLITSCHSLFFCFVFLEGFHVIFYVMENEVCSLFKFKTTTGCNRGLLNCIQVSVTGPHVFVFLVNFYILSPWFAFHLGFEDLRLCHVRLMNARSWPRLHSGCGNLTKEFIKREKKKNPKWNLLFSPHNPKRPSCQAQMMKQPKAHKINSINFQLFEDITWHKDTHTINCVLCPFRISEINLNQAVLPVSIFPPPTVSAAKRSILQFPQGFCLDV